ncbi:hypothetical protein V2I01_17030 [Micromonospora sp. BRA006-A]|nr:hypothetical protein [Micromonospora sp. BRA006-A]
MRLRWFRCRGASAPTLPHRVRGDNLPEWMRQARVHCRRWAPAGSATSPRPSSGGRTAVAGPYRAARERRRPVARLEQRPADDCHPEQRGNGGHHEERR